MEKVRKIVVIDSGYSNFSDNRIVGGINIFKNNDNILFNDNISDSVGHGTAVTNILLKQTSDIDIFIVKIFEKELTCDVELLIRALEYVEKNISCDLINLSLGVNYNHKNLISICDKLTKKGIKIISAFDNEGAISYPAAFNNVIGVDASLECLTANSFIWIENSSINVLAKGGNHKLSWLNNKTIIGQGSSFATPYVTAKLANILKRGIDTENLINIFKNEIVVRDSSPNNKINKNFLLEKIKKAAIFPFNKEIHSLLNFSELLSFEIDAIYDTKYSFYNTKKVSSLNNKVSFKIKNIDDLEFNNIDTLILGHLDEIENLTKINYRDILIKKCLDNNINVYSFDECVEEKYFSKFDEKNLMLYYPKKEYFLNNHYGKLNKISTPVIGIFGTTKQQGKFTLQLQLRENFLKNNYKVGQLGTEPNSLLFGMDKIYPFGYGTTLETNGYKMITDINNLIHEIDLNEPEVILIGSQSGTTPMLYNNLGQIPLAQLQFLIGSNPDIVILCINFDDDLEYIKRTIQTIEGLGDTTVIALGIYPFEYKNDWNQFNNKKRKVEVEKIVSYKEFILKYFNKKSFIIGDDSEISSLYELCCNYFSE